MSALLGSSSHSHPKLCWLTSKPWSEMCGCTFPFKISGVAFVTSD